MDLLKVISERHSVRDYCDEPLNDKIINKLNEFIVSCNRESGLNIQLVTNEPQAFNCLMAHYGKFRGVSNYFAIVGKKTKKLYEDIGYFGEKLVVYAQGLGLNTCWVALTYKKIKDKIKINRDEKLHLVIAVGYGKTQGNVRKSKGFYDVCKKADYPDWFVNGVKCALLAPSAMNQQKFYLYLEDKNIVRAKAGTGFYSKMDLGIIKYHFQVGAGKENFKWKD
jgi:hypothetical protein